MAQAKAEFDQIKGYRAPLGILELPAELRADNDTPYHLVLRKSENRNGLVWMIAPITKVNDILEAGNDNPEIDFETPTNNSNVLIAAFDDQQDHSSIRISKTVTSYVLLDLKNARCLNLHTMLEAGYAPKIVGQTLPTEFGHTQAITNKVLEMPQEVIPEGIVHFLDQSDPGGTSIINSFWEDIIKNKGTPRMAVHDWLDNMETLRIRIQALLDEQGMTVAEAKDYLRGVWDPENPQANAQHQNSVTAHYETIIGSLPDNKMTSQPVFKTPLFRLMQHGFLSQRTFAGIDRYCASFEELREAYKKRHKKTTSNVIKDVTSSTQISREVKVLMEQYEAGNPELRALLAPENSEPEQEPIRLTDEEIAYSDQTTLFELIERNVLPSFAVRKLTRQALITTVGQLWVCYNNDKEFALKLKGLRSGFNGTDLQQRLEKFFAPRIQDEQRKMQMQAARDALLGMQQENARSPKIQILMQRGHTTQFAVNALHRHGITNIAQLKTAYEQDPDFYKSLGLREGSLSLGSLDAALTRLFGRGDMPPTLDPDTL